MSNQIPHEALNTLAARYSHPAVRVMIRDLTQLAQELEQGTRVWPAKPPTLPPGWLSITNLEDIEYVFTQPRWRGHMDDHFAAWRQFAEVIRAVTQGLPPSLSRPGRREPHPAAIIALRLIWGAERFAELPTAVLKPPPQPFIGSLAHLSLPAPQSEANQLDLAVVAWLQGICPAQAEALRVESIQGFAQMVACFRAIGKLQGEVSLEDMAASYLAWARLLHADLLQLVNVASGWWSG
jgi:hypothetical protein